MKKTNRRPSGQTWASISSGGNRRQSHTRIKLSEVALKTWCIIDEGGQDATSCPQFAHALCWLADDRAVQGEQSRNKGHTGCSHGDTLQHFFFLPGIVLRFLRENSLDWFPFWWVNFFRNLWKTALVFLLFFFKGKPSKRMFFPPQNDKWLFIKLFL